MKQHQTYAGLSPQEVEISRREHGDNALVPPPSDSKWVAFLVRFAGPLGHRFRHRVGRNAGTPYEDGDALIFVLEVAALLSILVSCSQYFGWWGIAQQGAEVFFEPIGILVAILLATCLAVYYEAKANRAFAALNERGEEEPVKVIRQGNVQEVAKTDLVVGDVVVLATGDEVPADGELLEAVAMHVDESSLTGETYYRMKSADASEAEVDATYPTHHVLRSTKVMEGHGIMRVLRTGARTEYGKVYEEAQIDDAVRTPLNEQLDGLGNWITGLSYVLALLIVVGHVVWWFASGTPWDVATFAAYVLQKLMIAVTLIVVAVPEGLPMAVTLSLAYSMRSMLRTQNLVRRIHACETMGATTVICTDKTGTLTQNRMQVREATFPTLTDEIAEGIAVNSTASIDFSHAHLRTIGNPTEGALLLWLHHQGYDCLMLKRNAITRDEVPFTAERKYMKTTVMSDVSHRVVTYTKGAPEIVRAMCATSEMDDATFDATLRRYQACAYRTLGLAIDDHFLGIVAIEDPVRQDVPAAVAECLRAGVDVKIVTGDTPGTAAQIAREIGILPGTSDESIITGEQLAAMTDAELQDCCMDLKVIARARPLDKKRLVEALQRRNQVVAVTGDGTNDAPALRQAHVGLSMGSGTAVAKEASDITIIDDSFASIGRAVMWGRSLYKNIQRFLLFQLTVNVTACCIVFVGALVGKDSPLTVTQMLWINLIMDTFGAMALASLPPSADVMDESPRPRGTAPADRVGHWAYFRQQWRLHSFIVTPAMLREIVGVGLFFFVLLLTFLLVFQYARIESMADLLHLHLTAADGVSPYEQTLLFSIFVWTHFFYMFNARCFATRRSAFSLPMGRGFWTIVAVIVVGQLLITEVLYRFFNVEPLLFGSSHPHGACDLLIILALSSLVFFVREAWQLLRCGRSAH